MMKILIIGAGAIGVALGASLSDTGHSISFLASCRTGNAIEQDGIYKSGLFGEIHIPPEKLTVYYDYDHLPADTFDYILICTKTMGNPEVAEKLSKHVDCLKKQGLIVIMQNGWGNDLPYLTYFDPSIVYNARVITGFARNAPNASKITVHTAPILIGSLHGYPKELAVPLSNAIAKSGIPSEATDEVGKALWAKMLYNCTLNPLGAILKVPYGKLADCPSTVAIMNRLIHETFAVMKSAGYETFWNTPEDYIKEFYGKLVPDTYAHCSSTLQDIEKKQKTEIETLTGCILRLGKEHGIETPTHQIIYEQILFLESQF
jgi:2-dehydropantoate 2-reductase